MPLTQTRMLSLITAAHAYRDGLHKIGHLIARLRADPNAGNSVTLEYMTLVRELDDIHYGRLADESSHFARNAARNIKEAQRQRTARLQSAPKPNWRAAERAESDRNKPSKEELEVDIAAILEEMEEEKAKEHHAKLANSGQLRGMAADITNILVEDGKD